MRFVLLLESWMTLFRCLFCFTGDIELPMKIAVFADIGTTLDAQRTMVHMAQQGADLLIGAGES